MMFQTYTFKLLLKDSIFAVLNCSEEVFFNSLKMTLDASPSLSFDDVTCVVSDIVDGDGVRHIEEYPYCEDFSKFSSFESFRDFITSPYCHGVPFIPGPKQKCPFVWDLYCTAEKPRDCACCTKNPDYKVEFEEIPSDDT